MSVDLFNYLGIILKKKKHIKDKIMQKEPHPLWDISANVFVALSYNFKKLGEGRDEDTARTKAVVNQSNQGIKSSEIDFSPYIVRGSQLHRNPIELAEIKSQSLVLMVDQHDNWRKGRLFWVKSVVQGKNVLDKEKVVKATVRGLYLDDLLTMPWLILTDAYLFSTTIEEYYYNQKKKYFVYEPVFTEVESYITSIDRYTKVDVFSSAVSKYDEQNMHIKKAFELLRKPLYVDKE